MSKWKLLSCFLVFLAGMTFPVYAQENGLKNQGSMTVLEQEMRNMEEDYRYLEMEIKRLIEECYESRR